MIEYKDIFIHCPDCHSQCTTSVDLERKKLFFGCTRCGNSEEMPLPILTRTYAGSENATD